MTRVKLTVFSLCAKLVVLTWAKLVCWQGNASRPTVERFCAVLASVAGMWRRDESPCLTVTRYVRNIQKKTWRNDL